MSERSEALAARLASVNAELGQAIKGFSDSEWRTICPDLGWPVGVAAHHVVFTQGPILDMVLTIASGGPPPALTPEMLDASNAKHAMDYANVTQAETLALLLSIGTRAVDALRALTDEQLDRTAPMALAGGAPLSAEQMAEGGLIGHPTEHLTSIKAAIGGVAATLR